MAPPRLAVLIPLYNGASTIERALVSLRAVADRSQIEVVIVDDGSTDDGALRARAVLETLSCGSAEVLSQPNAGSGAARNRALERARAPWVFFLDADDELAADALELVAQADADATTILAATVVQRGRREVLRRRPPALTHANARRRLSAGNPLPICGLIARRSTLAHGFDESLRYLEDWDFLLRNAETLFARAERRPEVLLARIHVHDGNKSGHYEALGRARERVAAARLPGAEGTVERNNWRLQRAIGRRLQRLGLERSAFLALPSDPVLYAKFLAHALLGRALLAHDPYAVGQ